MNPTSDMSVDPPSQEPLPYHSTPAKTVQWKINEQHWDQEKTIVIRVEDELFKVNLSRLTDISEGFNALLGLPGVDGTLENPLYMGESVSKKEFRAFLDWIKHTAWKPLPSDDKDLLLSILKISSKWMCKPGMQYAVNSLELHSLDPWRKLELAQTYGIPIWVERAIPILIDIPLYLFTAEHQTQIGTIAFFEIAKAQSRIERERHVLATMAPPLFDGSSKCPYHGSAMHSQPKCNRAWNEAWWAKFGIQFLHPTKPLDFKLAFEFVRSTDFPGVTPDCKYEAQVRIVGCFDVEAKIKRAVVDVILALLPMGPLQREEEISI
ncbi:hypothetical protein VKT23_000094 [Stygiomarasmius scandens]|uniref:BTB domain-containing protein n=1 Tax=Marasmiellus scandens TaxID=2682957 RepID=A0ABR1K345_9AGAR